ncbi:hypothetical protein [Streptomyces sp. NPDC058548]|uniref:terpene synthase family protein n=1 Tax=unclassified Streptomyces TaxID=2593676 RepID=UPI003663A503
MSVPALAVPALYCPFPAAVHPLHEELDRAAVAWLEKFSLTTDSRQLARLSRSSAGELAARTSPRGAHPALGVAADLIIWMCAFDDAHCDRPGTDPAELAAVAGRLQRVLDAPWAAGDDDPFAAALCDLRLRVGELASPVQLQRWTTATGLYLLSQTWAASRRAREQPPSLALADYGAVRLHSGGVIACTALLDIVNGHPLPAAQAERPAVRALTEMCGTLVGWDNDLLSRHKELSRGEETAGLVDLVRRRRDCTPAEALTESIALRDQVMRRFVDLSGRLLTDGDPALRAYVEDLRAWVRGNIDWSLHCDRYLNPDHPAALPSGCTDEPPAVPDGPIGIPGLDWWWNVG